MLSPEEIATRQFLIALRGYDRDEVQAFLQQVADERAELQRRIAALEGQAADGGSALVAPAEPAPSTESTTSAQALAAAEPRAVFAALGEETTRILVAAEESARSIRERAEERARAELESSRREARDEVAGARRTASKIISDAEARRNAVAEEIRRLEGTRDRYAEDLRGAVVTVQNAMRSLSSGGANGARESAPSPSESGGGDRDSDDPARGRAGDAGHDSSPFAPPAGGVTATTTVDDAATDLVAGPDGLGPAVAAPAVTPPDDTGAAPSSARAEDGPAHDAVGDEPRHAAVAPPAAAAAPGGDGDDADAVLDRIEADIRAAEDRDAYGAVHGAGDAVADTSAALTEAVEEDLDHAEVLRAEQQVLPDAAAAAAAVTVPAQAGAHQPEPVDLLGGAAADVDADAGADADADASPAAGDGAASDGAVVDADAVAGADAAADGHAEGATADAGSPGAAVADAVADADAADPDTAAASTGAASQDVDAVRQQVDARALGLRAETLDAIRPGLLRILKRSLQDVQNGVLDALRRAGDAPDVQALLPADTELVRLGEVAEPHLATAHDAGLADGFVLAGAERAEPSSRHGVPATVEGLLSAMGTEITTNLRATLTAGVAAGEPSPSLGERVGEVFRDLKGPVSESIVDQQLARAYAWGQVEAWQFLGVSGKRWVVGDEMRCPEDMCVQNAAAGTVPLDAPFPTGEVVPPPHDGCDCTLAPA